MIKIAKIIIVSTLVACILSFVNFWLMPLIFCLMLIMFNLKEFNILFSLKFLLASYISFLIGITAYSSIGNFLEITLGNDFHIGKWGVVDISFLLAVSIISPILFFYFNSIFLDKLMFKENLKKILYVTAIILLGSILIYVLDFNSDFAFSIWQVVVAFLFQHLICEEKLSSIH